jgi:tetratricopeptide (TPR) repeat protein
MLDAMLESEPAEGPGGLLSVAGTHLGPYASALEALRSGRFEEGERLLRRCLVLAPEHPGAQAHLALHLAADGRADEALALCDATLKVLPYHVFMQSIRGWLLLNASRFDLAVDAYEQAIALSDDHGNWWINLVLGQVAQGKPEVAERTIASLEGRIRDLDLIAKLRRAVRDAG